MGEIGKALVFYNQYYPEMIRLYENEETFSEVEKRSDRDRIRKNLTTVGDAAGEEARIFLEACIESTRQRLETAKAAKLVRVSRPATENKYWEVAFHVFGWHQRKRNRKTRQIGITLTNKGVTPWIWGRGGVPFEERVKRDLLPLGTVSFSAKESAWMAGTVALTTVHIPWALAKNFTLGSAGFIEQTSNVCEAFTPAFIRDLIAMT